MASRTEPRQPEGHERIGQQPHGLAARDGAGVTRIGRAVAWIVVTLLVVTLVATMILGGVA